MRTMIAMMASFSTSLMTLEKNGQNDDDGGGYQDKCCGRRQVMQKFHGLIPLIKLAERIVRPRLYRCAAGMSACFFKGSGAGLRHSKTV